MTMPYKDEAGRLISIPCEPSPPPPKPLPIPQDCEARRDKFNTDKYPYWWYKNVKGEKLYIVYNKLGLKKALKRKEISKVLMAIIIGILGKIFGLTLTDLSYLYFV